MEKPVKIALGISVILLIIYAAFLIHDYIQFNQNLERITVSLESSDPAKLQAAWFSVVIYRSILFLVPALILGGGALMIHIMDNRKPDSRFRKLTRFR